MKRVIAFAAVCSISATAFADAPVRTRAVTGVGSAAYELSTGRLTRGAYAGRGTSNPIWDPTGGPASNQFYLPVMDWLPEPDPGALVLDWGDIADGSVIQGLQFGYATDRLTPIDCDIVFYADYNGYNNNDFYGTFGFAFTDLPPAMGAYNAWVITVDLEPNFTFPIQGNDLDGDGKADFGYSFWFSNLSGLDSATGPFLANPDLGVYGTIPAAEAALGIEDVICAFAPQSGDPNQTQYECFWFGGWDPNDPNSAYAQLYLVLFGNCDCCNPGASGNYCTADIDGSGDCMVGLPDLAALLSSYGIDAGGDIDPPGGDGDTDLQDLAALLAQYGDDCN